jgi:hypothetical protein
MWSVQLLVSGKVVKTYTYHKEKVARMKFDLLLKNKPRGQQYNIKLISPKS